MTTLKLLSREDLEKRLARIDAYAAARGDGEPINDALSDVSAHIAALEAVNDALGKERVKALADNAGLVSLLRLCAGDQNSADACLWCGNVPPIHKDRCPLDLTLEEPHPGAALLEEHRKALEPLQAVVSGLAGEMERAIAHREAPKGGQQVPFHGDFAQTPHSMVGRLRWWARELRSALRGEVPRLLVRARNEGLERARQACEALTEGQTGGVLRILRMAIKDIDALKEPEE
jgi:hypothetical protein